MCGIAGSVAWRDHAALGTFDIAKLSYRGPDALVTVRSSEIAQPPTAIAWKLAHARLSIIDLATTANQPMSTADGRYWLVFNGEIYNHHALRKELEGLGHRFRTDHSDSEVLLFACVQWGRACLERLNGMFAFAIWDKERKELFIARDRLGIKPVYTFEQEGRMLFASELRALLATGLVPRKLDTGSLGDYLRYQSVHAPATIVGARSGGVWPDHG